MVQGECVRGRFLGNKGVVSWVAGVCRRVVIFTSPGSSLQSGTPCPHGPALLWRGPGTHAQLSPSRVGSKGVGLWGQMRGFCKGEGGDLVASHPGVWISRVGLPCPFPGVRPRSTAPHGAQGSCRSFSPLSPQSCLQAFGQDSFPPPLSSSPRAREASQMEVMAKNNENLILGAGRLQQVGLGVCSQGWNESPGEVMGSSRGGTKMKP